MIEREKESYSFKEAKVLLVEDNLINQTIAEETLEMFDISVQIAVNGQEAVDMAAKTDFDLVLMDLQMPVMDGCEATRQIRLTPSGKTLPIVAMTAAVTVRDREMTEEAGMNGHIGKPIDIEELLEVLIRWLGAKRAKSAPRPVSDRAIELENIHSEFIDLPSLGKRVPDIRRLVQLLGSFIEDFGQGHVKLDSLQHDGDLLQHYVHSLKGVSGNLEMHPLHQLCKQTEAAIINGSCQGIGALAQKLEMTTNEVEQIISRIRPETPTGEEGLDVSELDVMAESLYRELEKGHYVAPDRVEKITAALAKYSDSAKAGELQRMLERFDYKQARPLLASLIDGLGANS